MSQDRKLPSMADALADLRVVQSAALRKVRLGSTHDGGYVVPDLQLEKVDCLYSVGVGTNLDFERDFRRRSNGRIKLFDPTISPPRNLPKRTEFFPVGLGLDSNGLESLFAHGIRLRQPWPRRWLKMDIESYEWEALDHTAPNRLQAFEVMIIEFHGLSDQTGWAARRRPHLFKKINRSFRLIHAHGNNFAPHERTGATRLPDCLEATYLRADLMPTVWEYECGPLPGPTDAPCNPQASDLDLNCWPFCAS